LAVQQAQASQNTQAAAQVNTNDSRQTTNNDATKNMAAPRANEYEFSQTNKDNQPKLSIT